MRHVPIVIIAFTIAACGGSEFESAQEASGGSGGTSGDASAGAGGTSETGGTAGVAGTAGTGGAAAAGGSAGTGGTDPGPTCAGKCAPRPVDPTWVGPVLAEDAPETTAPCTGDYPNPAATGWRDPVGTPQPCMCVCEPALAQEWKAEILRYAQVGCAGQPCSSQMLSASTCTPLTTSTCAGAIGSWQIIGHGACTYVTTEGPSAWSWSSETRSCGSQGATSEGCTDPNDLCMPHFDPPAALCLVAIGDLDCPPPPYDHKRLRFTEVDDQRECGPCECGPANTLGTVTNHATATCGSTPGTGMKVPEPCSALNLTLSTHAKFTPNGLKPECGPISQPVVEGQIVPTKPITFCCME